MVILLFGIYLSCAYSYVEGEGDSISRNNLPNAAKTTFPGKHGVKSIFVSLTILRKYCVIILYEVLIFQNRFEKACKHTE